MPKILVLGVGNILLTDDGLGVWAVRELAKEDWPQNVEFMDGGTFTQDMYHLFEGYDELLVLDVVHAGHAPGTIFRLNEDDLVQNDSQRLSLHDIDLIDSLKMADLIGKRPTMRILGMEPEDFTTWKMELTPTCATAMPQYLETARTAIKALLAEGAASA